MFHGRLRTVKVGGTDRVGASVKVAVFLAFLLLIGGVEPNPGPSIDDLYTLMQESKDKMEKGFNEVNERMAGMEKGLSEKLEKQEQKITKLEEENMRLRESLKQLEGKQDDLENRSRRNNLIFYGVPENQNTPETWDDCGRKILDIIVNDIKLEGITDRDVERAHRLGGQFGKRPIIVKFMHFRVKEKILLARRNLKGTNIFINEDFSTKIRQEREILTAEMKNAREKGDTATVTFNKLKINGKIYKYSWEEDKIVELPYRQQAQQAVPEERSRVLTRQEKRARGEETPAKASSGGSMDTWLQRGNGQQQQQQRSSVNTRTNTRGRGAGLTGRGGR